MRTRRTVAAVALIAGLTACSGSTHHRAPSASPTPDAAHQLAQLAALGTHQSYAAAYRLVAKGKRTGSLSVALIPPHYRLLIIVGRNAAEFLYTSKGTYTCGKGTHWECLAVARPGQPVPRLFDPGIEVVFTRYLSVLAQRATQYDVSITAPLPDATCFKVASTASTPAPRVADGTYCFTSRGIPVDARFASGRITLDHFTRVPLESKLTPPAKPTPLPR